jgi:hypothetical protein
LLALINSVDEPGDLGNTEEVVAWLRQFRGDLSGLEEEEEGELADRGTS